MAKSLWRTLLKQCWSKSVSLSLEQYNESVVSLATKSRSIKKLYFLYIGYSILNQSEVLNFLKTIRKYLQCPTAPQPEQGYYSGTIKLCLFSSRKNKIKDYPLRRSRKSDFRQVKITTLQLPKCITTELLKVKSNKDVILSWTKCRRL